MSHREAKPLLEAVEEREQALAREAEQTRARIGELTATLGELDEAIEVASVQLTAVSLGFTRTRVSLGV